MLDDSVKLLSRTGQEARHIGESHDGNLEGVAETNEAGCLHGGVDIKATSKNLGLISNHSHRLAFHFDEAS